MAGGESWPGSWRKSQARSAFSCDSAMKMIAERVPGMTWLRLRNKTSKRKRVCPPRP